MKSVRGLYRRARNHIRTRKTRFVHETHTLKLNVSRNIIVKLNRFPTETHLDERVLLYQYFRDHWSGQKHVLEIGPFLGGTTQAIALGMMDNPSRNAGSRIYTYDRFQNYYQTEQLRRVLKGYMDAHFLSSLATNSFLEIFRRLHQDQPYASLIVEKDCFLPESPAEIGRPNIFHLDPLLEFEAVFVDGCKSWFSTGYFMAEAASRTAPGAVYLFQDYGWYTCFWIPVFMHLFREYFSLMSYVQHTYVFRLIKPLPREVIESRYPASPEFFGVTDINRMFEHLLEEARQRDDAHAEIMYQLQQGAMLAYNGHSDLAKKTISQTLLRAPLSYEAMIAEVLKSPTYRPNGAGGEPIYLD